MNAPEDSRTGGGASVAGRSSTGAWFLALSWLTFLGAVLFRWLIADRGLDFTDESFALLAARHPGEMRVWASLFFDYTAPLLSLAGGDIAMVRRIGIGLFLLAAAALAHGLSRRPGVEEGSILSFTALFPLIALGSLVYYSRGVAVPNYNHITACGLTLGMGLLLSGSVATSWRQALLYAGAGFALAVAAGSKPPAVVAFVVAAVWTLRRPGGMRAVAALVAGAFAAVSISLFSRTPMELLAILKDGAEFNLTRAYGYEPVPALVKHATQAGELFIESALYATPSLLVAGLLRARGAARLAPLAAAAVLLLVLGLNDALLGGRSAARTGRTGAAILSAIIVGIGPGRELWARITRAGRGPLIGAALLLPVMGVLGSNTHFASALLLFMAPWFVIVPLCLLDSGATPAERWIRAALPALIAGLAAVSAPYVSPYGLTAPFAEQTVRATFGQPPTTIYTDRQTARFLGRLGEAARACGFTPGQDIVALMEMPGFVFALGGVSPALALYPREGDRIDRAIQMAMARVPEERLRRSFVLLNDHALRLGSFTIGGLAVPDDYDVCFDRDGPSKYGDMRVRLLKPRAPDGR